MRNDILDKILSTLEKYLDKNEYKFFLYGSRARWDFFFRSDYDIWVMWKKKLDTMIKMNIEEEFEKIPALIDFIDFSQVSEDFKKQVMKDVICLNE